MSEAIIPLPHIPLWLAVHATEIMYTYLHLDCYSYVDFYRVSGYCLQAPVILHINEWPGYCYDLYLQ